jgi:hypothetical protein
VRVLEPRRELHLTAEAVDAYRTRDLGREHLHHDLTTERALVGHEDA